MFSVLLQIMVLTPVQLLVPFMKYGIVSKPKSIPVSKTTQILGALVESVIG
jgi:hypothetical protein